jgi:hypothetical protein
MSNQPTTNISARLDTLAAEILKIDSKFRRIAFRCFERRCDAYAKLTDLADLYRGQGSLAMMNGKDIDAARLHAKAHGVHQEALEELAEAAELADDWEFPLPDHMDHSLRWKACDKEIGVGEGDMEMQNRREIDDVRLADMTDEELRHLSLGLKMTWNGSVERDPEMPGWFILRNEEGDGRQLNGSQTALEVWEAAELEDLKRNGPTRQDGEGWAPSLASVWGQIERL